MSIMTHRNFGIKLNKGLSLLECAMAILIVGTVLVTILEITTNTITTAMQSSESRLASLLASEIVSREAASLYELTEEPVEDGTTFSDGDKEVDTEIFGEMYKGFKYSVTKTYKEIDIETELSDDADEDNPLYDDDEEEEELPVVKIVELKVVVYLPTHKKDEEPATLTIETYVRPNTLSLTSEESGN